MSKFHINKHGVPATCKATKGNCPLGGEGEHFDSVEEAQAFIDEKSEQSFGMLPSTSGGGSGDGDGGNRGLSPLGGFDDAHGKLDRTMSKEYGVNEQGSQTRQLPSLNLKDSRSKEESLYDKAKKDGVDFVDPINKEYSELADKYEKLKSEGPPRERFLFFFSRKSKMSNEEYAEKELKGMIERENISEKKSRLKSMAQSIIHSEAIKRAGGRNGEGYEVYGVNEAINVLQHNGINVEVKKDSEGEEYFVYNNGNSPSQTLQEKDIISSAESIVEDLRSNGSPASKAMLSMYQGQAFNGQRSAYKGHHYRVEDVRKRPDYNNPIKLSSDFLDDDFSIVNSSSKDLDENFRRLDGHKNPGYYLDKAESMSQSNDSYGERDQDTSDAKRIATKMWRDNIYEQTRQGYVKEKIGDRLTVSNLDQARLVLKNKGLSLNPEYGDGRTVNWRINDEFRGKSGIPNDVKLNDDSIIGLANDIIDGARERNDESNLMFYQKVIDDKF